MHWGYCAGVNRLGDRRLDFYAIGYRAHKYIFAVPGSGDGRSGAASVDSAFVFWWKERVNRGGLVSVRREAEPLDRRSLPFAKCAKAGAPSSTIIGDQLLFGEVGVGFYFFNLVGMPFGVSGDEKYELIGVPFGAGRTIGSVIAKTRRVLHELFGFGAAFDEMIDGTLG